MAGALMAKWIDAPSRGGREAVRQRFGKGARARSGESVSTLWLGSATFVTGRRTDVSVGAKQA
jgi:hypothetical protein